MYAIVIIKEWTAANGEYSLFPDGSYVAVYKHLDDAINDISIQAPAIATKYTGKNGMPAYV